MNKSFPILNKPVINWLNLDNYCHDVAIQLFPSIASHIFELICSSYSENLPQLQPFTLVH